MGCIPREFDLSVEVVSGGRAVDGSVIVLALERLDEQSALMVRRRLNGDTLKAIACDIGVSRHKAGRMVAKACSLLGAEIERLLPPPSARKHTKDFRINARIGQ